MCTKRAAGTQFTNKGVVQGTSLVDPKTGLPITVIDDSGTKRLAVDAKITASIGDIDVELDFNEDSVSIGDSSTGNKLKINADGSIDTNVIIDAVGGDNVALGDPITGYKAEINSSRELKVKDDGAITALNSILSKFDVNLSTRASESTLALALTALNNILAGVNDLGKETTLQSILTTLQNTFQPGNNIGEVTISGPVEIRDLNANQDDVTIAGTENGTASGTSRHFVNNLKQQILATHDLEESMSWADFDTKNERVTQVDYTSATFPGVTIRKSLVYSLISGKYRLDDILWSIV